MGDSVVYEANVDTNGPMVYQASAFDSCQQGDQVPLDLTNR